MKDLGGRVGDAASFVSVARLVYSERSGRACKPQLDQSGEAYERRGIDLETAKDSNVALYLKLGFKMVGEWDVPKDDPLKMVPMKYR
jgi:hypothetical protein